MIKTLKASIVQQLTKDTTTGVTSDIPLTYLEQQELLTEVNNLRSDNLQLRVCLNEALNRVNQLKGINKRIVQEYKPVIGAYSN